MRKTALIATLLAPTGALLAQQEPDWSKVEIKATHVAGTVYMLEGRGGNIAASVGEDGIVVVDDQFAPLADKIRGALKGITDQPVRFVINTHWHWDHTGGNLPFGATATVIAQDNVRKRLAEGSVAGNLGSIRHEEKPAPKGALPIITFERDVSVHLNGEDVRALHYASGHTDGDSIVFFPQSNVAHLGDDFVRYGFPFIDLDSGGSVKGMIAALEAVIPRLPADVKVIPGHGAVATLDDVRTFLTMLKDTTAVVEKALAAGKTLEQMKQEKILAAWDKWSGDFIGTDAYLETLVNSLTGKPGRGFVPHD